MKNKIIFVLVIVSLITFNIIFTVSKRILRKGRKAFIQMILINANKLLSEILNMKSDDYSVCYYKGLIYLMYFDYDKSLDELSKSIKMNPKMQMHIFTEVRYMIKKKILPKQ